MEVTKFKEKVFHLVENLNDHLNKKKKQFSDVIDENGYQYVDIVMEGGGVLGIALVGFTYVLEQAGIRFLQIGGASAGAINALMLAGLGTPAEKKSEKILQELANVDMYEFVDGDSDARSIIDAWLKYGKSFSSDEDNVSGFVDSLFSNSGKIYVIAQALQVLDNVNNHLGLNPGKVFQDWVKDILRKEKIKTTRDLLNRLSELPKGLKHRHGESIAHIKAGLALVAADVSTQTKAVFPKMAELYWKNPDEVNPADFVRASMSIPIFFHPFRVNNIPNGEKAMGCWKRHADYEDTLPESCVFIDGGIMSNFPINLFHRPDRVPATPTFGVKLGLDEKKTDNISSVFTLASVIFNSARFNLDADFIARNQDYRKLVSCIGTGDHNWLNFSMSDKDKLDLFERGAKEADRFLREFDWLEYKEIREGLAQTLKAANVPKEMMSGDAVPSTIKNV